MIIINCNRNDALLSKWRLTGQSRSFVILWSCTICDIASGLFQDLSDKNISYFTVHDTVMQIHAIVGPTASTGKSDSALIC